MRAARTMGGSNRLEYYVIYDGRSEVCRVVPGPTEPMDECEARALAVMAWLEAGYAKHCDLARECVDRVRAKAENARNGQPG